jgi:hypothetical protein
VEFCTSQRAWSDCSVQPSADSCAQDDDSDCDGVPNEGCACIVGRAYSCGACGDGSKTCQDGKAGTYSDCSGGTPLLPYYLDEDGDQHVSKTKKGDACSLPAGASATPGDDCCDLPGSDSAKATYLGSTTVSSSKNDCGNFDYDCKNGDQPVGSFPLRCDSNCQVVYDLPSVNCGAPFATGFCATSCGQGVGETKYLTCH